MNGVFNFAGGAEGFTSSTKNFINTRFLNFYKSKYQQKYQLITLLRNLKLFTLRLQAQNNTSRKSSSTSSCSRPLSKKIGTMKNPLPSQRPTDLLGRERTLARYLWLGISDLASPHICRHLFQLSKRKEGKTNLQYSPSVPVVYLGKWRVASI